MAKKVSKLSSGLPICDNVMMCPNSAGRDMSTEMQTAVDGTYTMLVSFKQPKKRKYAYQVQYRTRRRLAEDGSWESWGAWQAAAQKALSANAKTYNVGAGLPFPAGTTTLTKDSTVSPIYWLTANVGFSTTSDYKTALAKASYTLPVEYSCIQYQVRVRTYDATNMLHGSWATSKALSVYRRVATQSEDYYKSLTGGLTVEVNIPKPYGLGTFTVESVRDYEGEELLLSTPWTQTAQSNSAPIVAPTSGNAAITATIERDQLVRVINCGEVLSIQGRYETPYGTAVELAHNVRVSIMDFDFDGLDMVATCDAQLGVLQVMCRRLDPNDVVSRVSCSATYTVKGKRVSMEPTSALKALDSTLGTNQVCALFTFKGLPSIMEQFTVKVTASSVRYGSLTKTYTATEDVVGHPIFTLNGITHNGMNAVCWLEGKMSQSVEGVSSIRLPEGSPLPFVTMREGRANAITLTGIIVDKDPRYEAAQRDRWEELASMGAGVYYFASPAGHTKKVLVESVNIEQERDGYAALTVNMQEVR